MRNNYNSYERLARIYARKDGVRVIVKGSGFMTDTEGIIVIADIPEELNKTLKDPSLAGLIHECGHIVHTTVKRFKDHEMYDSHGGLLNNIEDIRLFHLGIKKYPGYKGLQDAGLTFIRDMGLIPGVAGKEKISASTYLGACLQYIESEKDYSFFPEDIIQMAEEVRDIVSEVEWEPKERGQKQTEKVAEDIIKRLKEMKTNPSGKGKGGKDKGDECDDGNDGNGDSGKPEEGGVSAPVESGEEEGKSESGKAGESEPKDAEGDEEDESSEGESGEGDIEGDGDSSGASSDDETGTPGEAMPGEGKPGAEPGVTEPEDNYDYDGEFEDNLDKAIEGNPTSEAGKEIGSLMEKMQAMIDKILSQYKRENDMHTVHPDIIPFDKECDMPDPLKKKNPNVENIMKSLSKAEREVDSEVKKMKSRILPLLIAEKRDSFIREQTEGIIDDGNLYKLKKGNGRIYKTKVPGRKVDTAMIILNDLSGSMIGEKVKMLRRTLLAVGDTLQSLKIPFEILAFNTNPLDSRYIPYDIQKKIKGSFSRGYSKNYNRTSPLNHMIVKPFQKNYTTMRHLIPMLDAGNYNGDNESVWWAATRLLERREERKILMVLSDGMPNIEQGDDSLLEKDLKIKVREIGEMGIEIVGLGILTSAPKRFYPVAVEIQSIESISVQVYSSLAEILKARPSMQRRF